MLALLLVASGCVIDKMDANREPIEAGGRGGASASSGGAGGVLLNAGAANVTTAGATLTSTGGTSAAGAPQINASAGSGGTTGGTTSLTNGGAGVAGTLNRSGSSGGPSVGGSVGEAGRSSTGGTTATGGVAAGGDSAAGRSAGGNAPGGAPIAGSATGGSATGGLTGVAGNIAVAGAAQLAGRVESLGNNITRVTYDFSRAEQLADWLVGDTTSTTVILTNGLLHVAFRGGGNPVAVAQFRLPLRSTRLAFKSTIVSTESVNWHHVNAYLFTVWDGRWDPVIGYGLIHTPADRMYVENAANLNVLSEDIHLQQVYQQDIAVVSNGFIWDIDGVAQSVVSYGQVYQGTDRFVLLGGYQSTVQFDDVILEGEFAVPVVGR